VYLYGIRVVLPKCEAIFGNPVIITMEGAK